MIGYPVAIVQVTWAARQGDVSPDTRLVIAFKGLDQLY